ncbi:MAG: TMEM175 family protein [Hyphomicrobiales bacterium]|nr:TMEM175 family protein [Hyphomicrobiales bacterium]
MHKGRLEAFSDGVLAIVITIMVLELKVPHGADFAALAGLAPVFLAYVLSFVYVGIYWNNHHHMFQAVGGVDGSALWANLHLLFWLTLVPFVTDWMGENHFAPLPVALYGVVLIAAAIAYTILAVVLRRRHAKDSAFARAFGHGGKEIVSMGLYAVAIGFAFVWPFVSLALYALVAAIWLVPDRRFERALVELGEGAAE